MIEARDLTTRYGGTTVVDDLTRSVQPGRVTGVLGPNGAGRSPAGGIATLSGLPLVVPPLGSSLVPLAAAVALRRRDA